MPVFQNTNIVIVTPMWDGWAMRTLWSPWRIILIMMVVVMVNIRATEGLEK